MFPQRRTAGRREKDWIGGGVDVLAEGRLLRTFDAPSLGAAIDDGSLVREVF